MSNAQQVLTQNLSMLNKAVSWLLRSFDVCHRIGIKVQYTPEEFDHFENLTSRYARATDILINKIFRSLDNVELENGGTLIDVLNRAHKRGLFDSMDAIRKMKELRNTLAHDYNTEQLETVFEAVLTQTALLFDIIKHTQAYAAQYT